MKCTTKLAESANKLAPNSDPHMERGRKKCKLLFYSSRLYSKQTL